MKQFKRLSVICISLMMFFLLTGCAKVINMEYEDVDVTIVREYYKAPWTEVNLIGKMPVEQEHKASYCIAVNYCDKTYTFTDAENYAKYTGKVGETIKGVKEIKTYEDGTVKVRISDLK